MDLGLDGQVAVVFGGARGLGLAIARAFEAERAKVAIVDVDPETLEIARGSQSLGILADVTDDRAIREVAGRVGRDLGRPNHLVFAAGVGSGGFGFPFWRVEPSLWERVLQVNLIGAARVAQEFAPAMAEARSGSILFLASVAGQIGSQTDPPDSASKAGPINFAQCAAKDLAPFGVRVNTICPGMVRTALNRSVYEAWAAREPEAGRPSYEEWAEAKVRAVVPLGRWQAPEDVASMAVFLASIRAGNVTGQAINVDGGYVMHS